MKPLRRAFGFVPFLALLALPALAQPTERHLPLHSAQADAAIQQHALRMPSVQAALNQCRLRGYVRHPEADAVVRSEAPAATVVFLAFEKPGLRMPPGLVGGPVLMVVTGEGRSGRMRTRVFGGLVFADPQARRLMTGDQVPALAGTDASFETSDLLSSEDGDGTGDEVLDGAPSQRDFLKYLACAGFGDLACSIEALLTTPPIPQVVVIRALVCATFASLACLSQLLI